MDRSLWVVLSFVIGIVILVALAIMVENHTDALLEFVGGNL